MSETKSPAPTDPTRGSHPRRGRGRYKGPARPMSKYSRPPASEGQAESPTPSALQLETNEPAPTPSKAPIDLGLPPKPVGAIESLRNNRSRGPSRQRGPKSENPPAADPPSTSEKQPQVPTPTSAPSENATASPAPSAGASTNEPRRGSRYSRRGRYTGPRRRPDKQPARQDSSVVSTPREPSMESDSSSACSSSVPTPTHPPASLASIDEASPSGSRTGKGPGSNQKHHNQDGQVRLDNWAETTSNDNTWGAPISTTDIHFDRPAPTPTPSNKSSVSMPANERPASRSRGRNGPKNNEKSRSSGPVSLDTWAETTNDDGWGISVPTTDRPTPSSSSVSAPTNERPASSSRARNGPRNNDRSRPSAGPAKLDAWTASKPDGNTWTLEPVSSPRNSRISTPNTPDRRPTPSHDLAGPSRPTQPTTDESPTAMRRVGLAYVILGPGASVQTVFTDAESPWVMLSNLPRNFRKHHLQPLLAAFGPTRSVKIYEPRGDTKYLATARILFEKHEQARYAVDHLHGQLVMGKPITARLDTDGSGGLHSNHIPGLNDDSETSLASQAQSSLIANDPRTVIKSATVKVTWFAPTSTVYVTYNTAKFAMEKVKEMNGRTFMNRRVKMVPMFSERDHNKEQVAKENGGYMVRVLGLMGDPELDKLGRFVRSKDIVVHPNYSSETGLTKLREELADVAPLESFKLLPHRRDDLKLHALAQYTTPAAAAAAVKVFEDRRAGYLGNSPILVSRHLTVKYSISSKLAEVLQGEINKLHSWAIDDPDLLVRQNEDQHKPGFIQLLLAGNDTKQLVTAKSQLDRALGGVPLSTVDGIKIWDSYFTTEEGASFLESVAESCKICARADKRTNSVLLFGPGYARDEASQKLREKLVSHSRLRHVVRIQKPVLNRLACGGITILRNLLGRGNIYVDIFEETLTFYGDDEVARRVQNALDLMYSETGAKLRRKSDCVVCFCPPENPLLFSCGHRYCKSCFSQYVASAAENRTLPLLCIGEGCKASIPLSMITLHANQPDQEALFYAAFQAYVTAHPDQYRYCPTANCQYIYRVGPEDAIVQCKLCLSTICTHCHIEQHEGISCADYQASHDESEIQKSFDRWRARHNVKPCPNCAAPIEKIAGCNHMMCSACRTHMCWVCLAGFSKGDEVYDHMRSKHGGIGL
ncbi:Cell surface glycoprotein 1 [Rhizoctonia solani]|uniref:RBR-type E3 ubiquitin transferase n=1 Tax=Rhizoctonia solani TaxID=456999 RepID=A0A0K6GBI8_9AGAM|nr:Cell surface glycoprotein 1 [Rhizoctonia solani]